MAGADDGAAKCEYRPIRDDDAGLRQCIKAETAGQPIGDLAKPECQRRTKIAAEHKFMADGEQQRHVAWRRAVKKAGDQGPKHGLRQRHGPKHHRRAPAQEFDKQGDVMHWPGRGEKTVYSSRMTLSENRYPGSCKPQQ